jgi:hypothetical protein
MHEEMIKRGIDLCARREKAWPMPRSRSRRQANTARGMRCSFGHGVKAVSAR